MTNFPCYRFTLVATFVSIVMFAGATKADVFNMPSGQTSLQFVTVGDPGNAPDTTVMTTDASTGYGSVPNVYQMGKFDVTVGQYCQFLNAVATTSDPYGLYNSDMADHNFSSGSPNPNQFPTIQLIQSGSSGNFSYTATGSYSQAANCPVFDVTWGDAARFCNWLQNGQPTGAEGNGTTETGSYNLSGQISNAALMAVTRTSTANYAIPTENEWYKAAYYKSGGTNAGYWTYPTQSNTPPSNVLSATTPNDANYCASFWDYTDSTNFLTLVGAFADSPGPYGTYDMGGDVWERTDGIYDAGDRVVRGGGYPNQFAPYAQYMSSAFRNDGPASESDGVTGFRIVSEVVPEPSSFSLLAAGAIALVGYGLRRRRKASLVTKDSGQVDGPTILTFPSRQSHWAEAKRRAA